MTPLKTSDGLGSRVRQLREACGWSHMDLARRASIAPRTVIQIERETRIPHPTTVERLADALRVNSSILLHGAAADDKADDSDLIAPLPDHATTGPSGRNE